MSSKTEIFNLALAHLGVGISVSDADLDNSNEAKYIRTFYDIDRRGLLEEADWSFAKKEAVLSLVSENPTDEFGYSYRYPVDCLYINKIKSGVKYDSADSRVRFNLYSDGTKKLIYTDISPASIIYTADEENASLFSSKFSMALSYLLASHITMLSTGNDQFGLSNRMYKLYRAVLSDAIAKDTNEEQMELPPETDYINSRN